MRHLAAILLTCCAVAVHAQNWALLDPAFKYNYSNDGSDTINAQVFVTHIDTLGPDSFLYRLNRIAAPCLGCTTSSTQCDPTAGILDDMPQFIGGWLMRTPGASALLLPDTLIVRPDAAVGASWQSPVGGQATVTYAHDTILFGVPDSVKGVQYADGRSLRLSKAHGLLGMTGPGGTLGLIGVQGAVNAGAHYPEIIDLFDYQPGDVLQYQGGDQGFNGTCYIFHAFQRKYTVIGRTDQPGRTDYQMRRVYSWYTYTSGPCPGAMDQGVDTVLLGVEHAQWTPDNFLANAWLDRHWPDALATMPQNIGQSEYGDGELGFIWKPYRNADGRVVLETEHGDPGGTTEWPTVARCYDDSLYWFNSPPYGYLNRYVEGVGFDTAYVFAFEHTGWIDLMGYSIGGGAEGTILPDDIILAGQEPGVLHAPLLLSPNPASEVITVEGARTGEAIAILDATGRSVLTRNANSTREGIAIDHLPPGVYLLRCGNTRVPQRFIIAR